MSKTGLEFRSALRVSAKYSNLLASLWLCPPEGSPIEAALIRLITTTIPTHFGDEKVPSFRPHLTLTSDIPLGLDPQTVIDSITISELPEIVFSCMRIGSVLRLLLVATVLLRVPTVSHYSQKYFLHPWYLTPEAHLLSSEPSCPVPRKVHLWRTI